VILSAALVGCGAALLALPRTPARRLETILPRAGGTSVARPDLSRRQVLVMVGAVLWWFLGGVAGGVVGALVAFGVPVLLTRLDGRGEQEEEQVALQLPLALDLVGACLAGGSPLVRALTSVAGALDGPVAVRLLRVAAALDVGAPTEEAFGELGGTGVAGSAARALRRATESGIPVAAAVQRVAEDARRSANTLARKRVRQAGVKAAGPITLCFLPAFLVLGTVPTIVAVTGPLLKSF
jgi:pilus assembly protein TadC